MPINQSTSTALILLSIFLTISCTTGNSDIEIGLNENIHHDDFEYSVTNFQITKKIISYSDSLIAKGKFYIISFVVINEAKRVNHSCNNSIAYIADKSGNKYENDSNAQKILNQAEGFGWSMNYTTRYQSSDSTKFVFDLPVDVEYPCLLVRGETLMGDFFDGGKFKRTKIRLY